MVKILSTGEIVPDDDPRAGQASNRGVYSRNQQQQQQPRQGHIRHDEDGQQGMQGQQVNIFETLNQKLLAAGVPRFNVGPYTVEPIVLVGFCLAGLLLGMKGLLLGAVLFFVVKMSTGGMPNFGAAAPTNRGAGGGGGGQGGGDGQSWRGGGGGGHRLGR